MAQIMDISITCEAELETPEHSEKVTHSAPGYAKAVREMMRKAEGHWGWCTVTVNVLIGTKVGAGIKARIIGAKIGAAHLGNCSYLNAEDFVKNSGYFEDLVKEALANALKS